MKPRFDLHFRKAPKDVRLVSPTNWSVDLQTLRDAEAQAFERGREQGEKELSDQLIRQRSELLELQNGILDSLRQVIPQLTRECEHTLVALALQAAQKLVAGLPISAELIEATVREALAKLEETSASTVLLNPADLELLQQVNSPVLLGRIGGERLQFRTGTQVTRGGCIVETRFGMIDARRETKVELLKKSLDL